MTKDKAKNDCSLNMRMTKEEKIQYMRWAREAGFRSTAEYFRVAVYNKRKQWEKELQEILEK